MDPYTEWPKPTIGLTTHSIETARKAAQAGKFKRSRCPLLVAFRAESVVLTNGRNGRGPVVGHCGRSKSGEVT